MNIRKLAGLGQVLRGQWVDTLAGHAAHNLNVNDSLVVKSWWSSEAWVGSDGSARLAAEWAPAASL